MSDRQAGPPDRRALEMDLGGAAFELGERDKRWRLAAPLEWPYAYIAVSAVERPKAPKEFSLRFNCVGYPKGITASLWDLATKSLPPIAQWPAGKSRVPAVFRPEWKDGQALYVPCDRISIQGHDAWHTKHPSKCWSENVGIVVFERDPPVVLLGDGTSALATRGARERSTEVRPEM